MQILNMAAEKFTAYTVEDFVLDDSFQGYVLESNAADVAFWEAWRAQHQEKEEAIHQATLLVKALSEREVVVSKAAKKQAFRKLLAAIEKQEEEQERAKVIPLAGPGRRVTFNWWLAAAALSGLLMLGVSLKLLIFDNAETRYKTGFGEIKEIVLPDNSKVVLNSNSELSFKENWGDTKPRAVKISGEAFFTVRHTANHQKFTVTTSAGNVVEVLGTQFNVSDRKSKSQVVLKTGKVRLSLKQTRLLPAQQIMMAPGELIEVKANAAAISRKKVNPEVYCSWQENVLVFEDATLTEISAQFLESYGLAIVIAGQELAELKVSGVASTLELEAFLTGLSKLHHFKVRKAGGKIYLEPGPDLNQK